MDADATAELVNSDFSVSTEDLPEAMYSHCSIQIDDENIKVFTACVVFTQQRYRMVWFV